MSVLNKRGEDQQECPLCMEPLEVDDLNFYPCTCGYQICRFCWHRIRNDENGLCPACRKAYAEDPADFTPLTQEEMARLKAEKRQRDQQRKAKLTESRKHLASVRVVQKNLVFVVGLPLRFADPEILKRHEYFGKFGRIHKVVINQSTAYAGSQGPSASAYVTYMKSDDALRAIQQVNNITIDGRVVKCSLGTTKYCSHFMKNQPCPKPDCMYLHDFGDSEASFTKEQMHAGKHQEYERKLHENLNQRAATTTSQPGGGSQPVASKPSVKSKDNSGGGVSNGGGASTNKENWPQLNTNSSGGNGNEKDRDRKSQESSGSSSGTGTKEKPQKGKSKSSSNSNSNNGAGTNRGGGGGGGGTGGGGEVVAGGSNTNNNNNNSKKERSRNCDSQCSNSSTGSSSGSSSSKGGTVKDRLDNQHHHHHHNKTIGDPKKSESKALEETSEDVIQSQSPTIPISSQKQIPVLDDDNSSFFSQNSFQKIVPEPSESETVIGPNLLVQQSGGGGGVGLLTDSLPLISTTEDWEAAFCFPPRNHHDSHHQLLDLVVNKHTNGIVKDPLELYGSGTTTPSSNGFFIDQNMGGGMNGFYDKIDARQSDSSSYKNGFSFPGVKPDHGAISPYDLLQSKILANQQQQQQQQQLQRTAVGDSNMDQFSKFLLDAASKIGMQKKYVVYGENGRSAGAGAGNYQEMIGGYPVKTVLKQQELEEQLLQMSSRCWEKAKPYQQTNGQTAGVSRLQAQFYQQQQNGIDQDVKSLNIKDDLGFDPIQETQKAFAEMMAEQNPYMTGRSSVSVPTNHLNGLSSHNQGGVDHNRLPPPPGFFQSNTHMNSFGSKILPYLNMANSNHQQQQQQQQQQPPQQQQQQPINGTTQNGVWPTTTNGLSSQFLSHFNQTTQQQQQQQHLRSQQQQQQQQQQLRPQQFSQQQQLPQQHKNATNCNDWKTLDPAILSSSRHFPLANMPPVRDHYSSHAQQPVVDPSAQTAPFRYFDYNNFNHINTQQNLNWFASELNSQINSPPGFRNSAAQASKQQEC